jgi:hypothetical protein
MIASLAVLASPNAQWMQFLKVIFTLSTRISASIAELAQPFAP